MGIAPHQNLHRAPFCPLKLWSSPADKIYMDLRTVVLALSLLIPAFAGAKSSQKLLLQGTVPLKAEVSVSQSGTNGQRVLQNLSSAPLRYTVTQRAPASVVTVEAP